MTNSQANPRLAETQAAPLVRRGRGLASAIAVFLGGYLLLSSFASLLTNVSLVFFAGLAGRPSPELPASIAVLLVLQFLFAVAVVAVGLLIGGGPVPGRLFGVIVVAVGALLTFVVVGMRLNALLPFPAGQAGVPFQAVFANTWFGIVLFVGIAWLLARRARLGWLSLLGTLVLIPVPTALLFANADSAVLQIVMFLLSGIVGAAIILAGRPWRE